jgi:hypothetical protein
LPSTAVVFGVSAIRPNAKPEISIAAPSTIANIRCDLVIGYPPSREADINGDPEKAQQTGRHIQCLEPRPDLDRISPAICQHARIRAGITTTSNAAFFSPYRMTSLKITR